MLSVCFAAPIVLPYTVFANLTFHNWSSWSGHFCTKVGSSMFLEAEGILFAWNTEINILIAARKILSRNNKCLIRNASLFPLNNEMDRFIFWILLTIRLACIYDVLTLRESKCDWHLYSEAVQWPLNSVGLYSPCHIPTVQRSVSRLVSWAHQNTRLTRKDEFPRKCESWWKTQPVKL